jgi:hypothetical protein
MVNGVKEGSGTEAKGTADEGVAALVKAEQAVGGAGDADAAALAEEKPAGGRGGGVGGGEGGEPEGAGSAEVGAVEGAINAEGSGQAAGAAGEVQEVLGVAVKLHLRDAVDGLKSADEDAAADSGDFGTDVEHEMVAIAEIDVGVAAAEEHGASARGGAAKVVGGGVTLGVSLGFDDAAAEARSGEFADDDFADQEAGQGDGVGG